MKLFTFLAVFAFSASVLAEDAAKPEPTVLKTVTNVMPKKAGVKKKSPIKRTRDIEGTQAPNRFEAETVIKSHYELDGKPLEVDPD